MVVVDASVIAVLLLEQPSAPRVSAEIRFTGGDLHAPHLIDAEVGHVLRRFALRGVLAKERGVQALDALGALPITRYPHAALVRRAFAMRENVSFHDALYLALAEALDAPLLTADRALAHVPGTSARVTLV